MTVDDVLGAELKDRRAVPTAVAKVTPWLLRGALAPRSVSDRYRFFGLCICSRSAPSRFTLVCKFT